MWCICSGSRRLQSCPLEGFYLFAGMDMQGPDCHYRMRAIWGPSCARLLKAKTGTQTWTIKKGRGGLSVPKVTHFFSHPSTSSSPGDREMLAVVHRCVFPPLFFPRQTCLAIFFILPPNNHPLSLPPTSPPLSRRQ